jgi:hypothetical protein
VHGELAGAGQVWCIQTLLSSIRGIYAALERWRESGEAASSPEANLQCSRARAAAGRPMEIGIGKALCGTRMARAPRSRWIEVVSGEVEGILIRARHLRRGRGMFPDVVMLGTLIIGDQQPEK